MSNTLKAGQSLGSDEALTSTNSRFRLVMQKDNDLVLYDKAKKNKVLWSTRTDEASPSTPKLTLKTNGGLVLSNGTYDRWQSPSAGRGDASSILKLEDSGNLLIYAKGTYIWQTNTAQRPIRVPTNNLKEGEDLINEEYLESTNKKYKLIMQNDGNLVLYTVSGMKEMWSTGTRVFTEADARAILDKDGNLVVADWGGGRWSSNTAGTPKPLLTLQDDGNLTLTSNGKQIWFADPRPRQRDGPADRRNSLYVGDALNKNERITSLNDKYYVTYDGYLLRVCKRDRTTIWSKGEGGGVPNDKIKVSRDGGLEVFEFEDETYATLGNGGLGNPECFYIIQDDGDFVLMTNGKQAWHTETKGR